jgi:hypothetical protein
MNEIIKGGASQVPVKQLAPIKMKDKAGRNRLVLNMKDVFGFIPEILIIDKIIGGQNTIQIAAVIPEGNNEKKRKKGIGVGSGKEKTPQGA